MARKSGVKKADVTKYKSTALPSALNAHCDVLFDTRSNNLAVVTDAWTVSVHDKSSGALQFVHHVERDDEDDRIVGCVNHADETTQENYMMIVTSSHKVALFDWRSPTAHRQLTDVDVKPTNVQIVRVFHGTDGALFAVGLKKKEESEVLAANLNNSLDSPALYSVALTSDTLTLTHRSNVANVVPQMMTANSNFCAALTNEGTVIKVDVLDRESGKKMKHEMNRLPPTEDLPCDQQKMLTESRVSRVEERLFSRCHYTCLSSDPTSRTLVAGDTTGRMFVWTVGHGKKKSLGSPTHRIHWHHLPVRALHIAKGGSPIYSCGTEGSFVVHTVHSSGRSTRVVLPRMGGQLVRISADRASTIAVTMADMSVQLIDTTSMPKVVSVHAVPLRALHPSVRPLCFPRELIQPGSDPRASLLLTSARTGHLQAVMSSVSDVIMLDIAQCNQPTIERATGTPPYNQVTHVDVIRDEGFGSWLVTVHCLHSANYDGRPLEHVINERYVTVWRLVTTDGNVALEQHTRIALPNTVNVEFVRFVRLLVRDNPVIQLHVGQASAVRVYTCIVTERTRFYKLLKLRSQQAPVKSLLDVGGDDGELVNAKSIIPPELYKNVYVWKATQEITHGSAHPTSMNSSPIYSHKDEYCSMLIGHGPRVTQWQINLAIDVDMLYDSTTMWELASESEETDDASDVREIIFVEGPADKDSTVIALYSSGIVQAYTTTLPSRRNVQMTPTWTCEGVAAKSIALLEKHLVVVDENNAYIYSPSTGAQVQHIVVLDARQRDALRTIVDCQCDLVDTLTLVTTKQRYYKLALPSTDEHVKMEVVDVKESQFTRHLNAHRVAVRQVNGEKSERDEELERQRAKANMYTSETISEASAGSLPPITALAKSFIQSCLLPPKMMGK